MLTSLLKPGAISEAVVQLRRLLDVQGFLLPGGPAGGQLNVYDPALVLSVEQFQASRALHVDGIVGPMTWDALLSGGPGTVALLDPKALADDQERLTILLAANAQVLYKDWTNQPNVKAVCLAIMDLGKRESPNGSNTGPAIKHLVTHDGKSYYQVMGIKQTAMPPWCALAVSHWTREAYGQAGKPKPAANPWAPYPTWYAGAWQYEAWALKQRGLRWRGWGDKQVRLMDLEGNLLPEAPWQPGEIFVMGRDGSGSDAGGKDENAASLGAPYTGHTGLVVADMGATVITIEGNTSNAVCWRERKKTTLRGRVIWWNG